MTPSLTDVFWDHFPNWAWPIIVVGILAMVIGFVVQAASSLIKAYEPIAKIFGRAGRSLYDNANKRKLDRIEASITSRNWAALECAVAYLIDDNEWHYDAEIVISEHAPKVLRLLPHRIPFSEYKERWKAGWRPQFWHELPVEDR